MNKEGPRKKTMQKGCSRSSRAAPKICVGPFTSLFEPHRDVFVILFCCKGGRPIFIRSHGEIPRRDQDSSTVHIYTGRPVN